MTDFAPAEEQLDPVCGAAIVYLGPVAPHWEIRHVFGEQKMIDEFRTRVNARLLLLPRHDPQFRRNKERVNRDAERELIRVDWDLGDDDSESSSRPGGMQRPATEIVVEEVVEDVVEEVVEEVALEDVVVGETEAVEEALVEPEESPGDSSEEE